MLKIYWIVLTLSGCASLVACKKEGPNIDELCQLNGDGTAECFGLGESYTKDTHELINYIAVSPDNYEKILKWGRKTAKANNIKLSSEPDWLLFKAIGSKL